MDLTFDYCIEWVSKRWSEDPAGNVCVKLIRHLESCPVEEMQMLTFSSIGKIVEKNALDETVVTAVAILVSSKIHLLEKKHLFIDVDGKEFEVSNEEWRETKTQHIYIHPDMGEPVKNWEQHMIPFFVPSELALKMRKL